MSCISNVQHVSSQELLEAIAVKPGNPIISESASNVPVKVFDAIADELTSISHGSWDFEMLSQLLHKLGDIVMGHVITETLQFPSMNYPRVFESAIAACYWRVTQGGVTVDDVPIFVTGALVYRYLKSYSEDKDCCALILQFIRRSKLDASVIDWVHQFAALPSDIQDNPTYQMCARMIMSKTVFADWICFQKFCDVDTMENEVREMQAAGERYQIWAKQQEQERVKKNTIDAMGRAVEVIRHRQQCAAANYVRDESARMKEVLRTNQLAKMMKQRECHSKKQKERAARYNNALVW
jgi:hypothetical protein